ncbi:hypothetical protein KFL_006030100 [Klebsormidium nitens]|uniref:Uncharacterized protein n=1 Tax=Klebsormidium nitens TaxID=105231 RepID=A0A1Y1INC9_KLENI|nr:hypothetical protein KFL_006030100 [Klebsormidium nitens]|eukprot:GAQ90127.1 hypothetical protein KFL_006030100 [Klebsormidium nitens]
MGLQRSGVLLRLERWWAGVPQPSTLQLGFATAAFAVVFKLAMLYDESCEPERAAMKAREQTEANARAGTLTRREWERLQQVRPHSPFDTQRGPQGDTTHEGLR